MRRFDAKSDRFGDGDARILRSPARRGRPHGELNWKASRRPHYEVDQRLANASGPADRCRCQYPAPLRAVLKAALH